MGYSLHTPLNVEEADALAEQHAFQRIPEDDFIRAEFATEVDRDAALQDLSAIRLKFWRAQPVQ